MGGGNAMPKAVLAGLKEYPVKITAISAVFDTGGSTGRLRQGFQTPISFGDIRRAVLALSEAPKETKDYFSYRDWDGHVMANAFCTAMAVATGSPEKAINKFVERLKVPSRHQILPATLDDAQLYAVLNNSQTVEGETNIDISKHKGKIKEVFLKPQAKAYSKTLEAIKQADLIVIGPGDLYSSLAQILLIQEIPETLRKSKAKKVYVANLMTKHGETDDFSVLDSVNEIEKYLGGELDYVIYNNAVPLREKIKETKKENPLLVDYVKFDENLPKDKFLGEDLLPASGLVIHDPQKLAKIIINLCKQ